MSTGYAAGMREHWITIQNRTAAQVSDFGLDSAGASWVDVGQDQVAIDFVRGIRAMHEGALDVYGVIMVRMNYRCDITARSRIVYEGQTYQILGDTFHAEPRQNRIQFQAQLLINDK